MNLQNQWPSYISAANMLKEIEGTLPFTSASKKIKYPGVNLTKQVKGLYNKNLQASEERLRKTLGK